MSKPQTGQMRYDLGFQRSVLKLMLIDPKFCQRSCAFLEPVHFSGELSWFFNKIKDLYQLYSDVPTRDTIAAEISAHSVNDQLKYYAQLDEIFKTEPQPEHIKKVMTGFVRCNIFVEATRSAANAYNNGTYDYAFKYARDRIEALFEADFGNDPFVRFGDYKKVLEDAKNEKIGAIPTGIHAIDEAMGGGMMPGTWTTFLGASNAGKSMLMPNLAKQAVDRKKRVLVTIHEDEENPTKLRYLSCFSGVPISVLSYGIHNLTPEQQKAVEIADITLKEYVVLRFMYTSESTVENVMDVARNLMKEWKFDLFLCDYGQCLTSRKFKDFSEVRHLNEHVYHMLKQLCLELKIPGAGGAQVNRQAMTMNRTGSEFLRCTDVSEAFGIIKKSNNVITINRSNEDVIANRIKFLLDKTRNGRCPVAVECISDYKNSVTHRSDLGQTELDVAGGPASNREDSDKQQPKKLAVT